MLTAPHNHCMITATITSTSYEYMKLFKENWRCCASSFMKRKTQSIFKDLILNCFTTDIHCKMWKHARKYSWIKLQTFSFINDSQYMVSLPKKQIDRTNEFTHFLIKSLGNVHVFWEYTCNTVSNPYRQLYLTENVV